MKTIPLATFMETGYADDRAGIYHVGDGLFELRCTAGKVEFEPGRTVHQLPDILTILAARGVRRLPLEWDGW
jgi:hypothetical protein